MNKRLLIGTALAVAAAFVVNTSAFAQKADTAPKSVTGKIKAIDVKEKTITIAVKEGTSAGKDKTLEVPASAKIDKENKINLHLKDLKEGDEVSVSYRKVKEPSADKKTMVETLKAFKITVLSSAEAGGGAATTPTATPAPPATPAPAHAPK